MTIYIQLSGAALFGMEIESVILSDGNPQVLRSQVANPNTVTSTTTSRRFLGRQYPTSNIETIPTSRGETVINYGSSDVEIDGITIHNLEPSEIDKQVTLSTEHEILRESTTEIEYTSTGATVRPPEPTVSIRKTSRGATVTIH